MNVANRIIKRLLREARAEGFSAYRTYDGGAMFQTFSDEAVMDVVDSVEESCIHFKNRKDETFWVYVIPSNDEDVICDYSQPGAIADVIEKVMQRATH